VANRRVSQLHSLRAYLALAAAWATAEATVWPIMPDFVLVPCAAARPATWWRLTLAASAGTAAGGCIMHALGRRGAAEPLLDRLPLVCPPMVTAARYWLASQGPRGLRHQPLSGLPYKVFALHAGTLGLPLGEFMAWSLAARGTRFLAVSGVAALISKALGGRVQRLGWPLLGLWSVVFLFGLRLSVRSWERRSVPPID
jgi:membrane protein YqaA with SNARE-associated domain